MRDNLHPRCDLAKSPPGRRRTSIFKDDKTLVDFVTAKLNFTGIQRNHFAHTGKILVIVTRLSIGNQLETI